MATVGSSGVPDRPTFITGVSGSLLAIDSTAATGSDASGRKVMVRSRLAPRLRMKLEASIVMAGLSTETEPTLSVSFPRFVTPRTRVVDDPTNTDPKSRGPGDTEMFGAARTVSETGTITEGVTGSSLSTWIAPVKAPASRPALSKRALAPTNPNAGTDPEGGLTARKCPQVAGNRRAMPEGWLNLLPMRVGGLPSRSTREIFPLSNWSTSIQPAASSRVSPAGPAKPWAIRLTVPVARSTAASVPAPYSVT